MQLCEQYRPHTWAQVIGQSKVSEARAPAGTVPAGTSGNNQLGATV
jgi:hypothetical protein